MYEKVHLIMDQYPETRDNDTKLFCKFMNMFCDVELSFKQVDKMLNWPSYASIIRERSRIQNVHKELVPSLEVQISRHQSEKKYRERYWPLYPNDL